MGYIQDEDLKFLKDVKSEDLDKLVKILITPKTEELTKKDIYKEFAQDHNIYWEEIAAELQLFGGDTIANSVRGRGVKYSEILKDVCRAFDIKLEDEPFLKESIVEKLVNKALKMEMNYPLSIRSLENQLLNKILESDLDKAIQEYNRTKAIKLALLPTKRLSDPNFQVMAQSVYEIAKLRKDYNKQSQEDPKNKKLPLVYSESLTIVDDKDVKMGELKLIDPTSISDLKLENSNNNEINRTMQFIADSVKGYIGTASSKTVELVFSQKSVEFMKNKKGEVLSILVDSDSKKIKEIPKLKLTGQTKQLLTGGYQLLSIAVAQSHLADIEKSLSSIKSLVRSIQDKLEAEDRANLKGAIRYLENKIIPLIKNYDGQNEIAQEYKNEFQSIIRDIYTWENKFLEEFEILNKEIQQLNSKDIIGTGNTYEELKTLLKRIEPLKKRYGLILKLSNVLNVVQKFVYFDEKNVLNIDIQLEPFQNLMDEYNMSIDSKKVTLLDSNFNKNDTSAERKKFIEILQNKQNNDFEQFILEYQKQSQSIDEYFENFKNGRASIILSFDEESNIDKYAINYL